MRIKNWSRDRKHKFDGVGVGRIEANPLSYDSGYDSVASNQVKTSLSEELEHLRLQQYSFH